MKRFVAVAALLVTTSAFGADKVTVEPTVRDAITMNTALNTMLGPRQCSARDGQRETVFQCTYDLSTGLIAILAKNADRLKRVLEPIQIEQQKARLDASNGSNYLPENSRELADFNRRSEEILARKLEPIDLIPIRYGDLNPDKTHVPGWCVQAVWSIVEE